ncbi:MAG: LamG-like jellyroll fold domain-containing protein [Candidatus Micrarchaeia archaeon]
MQLQTTKLGQLTLEFAIVYSYILLIFIIVFAAIATQRGAILANQEGTTLEFITQNIALYIDQAIAAGSGYSATIPILGTLSTQPYNITISSTGVIIATTRIGAQILKSYAYSDAKNLVVNGTTFVNQNSIKLYQLNLSTGSIKISNVNGSIYIDENPQNTSSLPSKILYNNVKRTNVAYFNNACLFNNVSYFNNIPNFTLSAWLFPLAFNSILFYNGNLTKGTIININQSGSVCINSFNKGLGVSGGSVTLCSTQPLNLNKWNSVRISLIKGSIDTGTFLIFINGNETSGLGQEESIIASNAFIVGCNSIVPQNSPNFYGLMGNIQIYNTSINGPGITSLYKNGLISGYVEPQNLIAYFKLDYNAFDSSGFNNNLNTLGISYVPIIQINDTILSNNASTVNPPSLIGIVANNALINNVKNAALRFCYSNYIYMLPTQSNTTAVVTLFNGNQSLIVSCNSINSTLYNWWPINEGFGNVIYDLSGNNKQLSFSTYNGFPKWQNINTQPTNLQSLLFPSSNAGYVITPIPYNNINTFTITFWINASNTLKIESSNGYTIFNSIGNNNFEMWLNNGNGAGALPGSGDEEIGFGNNYYHGYGVNGNVWNFIAVTVTNGYASFYTNSQGPFVVPIIAGPYSLKSLSIAQSAAGITPLNGSISNIQIYNSTLTTSQIKELYNKGMISAPVNLKHLIAWYPLYGNLNDYSANNYNGQLTGSALFTNFIYQNNQNSSNNNYILLFNPAGQNSLTAQTTSIIGSKATLTAWINPKPIQLQQSGIFYYGPQSSCPSETGNILNISLSSSLIPTLNFGCESFLATSMPLIPYSWNFVATTINNNKVELFVNGYQTTFNAPSTISIQSGQIIIGGLTATSGIFNGSISDVQLYNSILNNTELMQLYEQGLPAEQRLVLGGK